MKRRTMNAAFVAVSCMALVAVSMADVKPAPVFADGMVLQRDLPVRVWGSADADESVSVSFAGQTLKTKADSNGSWRVELEPLSASKEGRTLVVCGKNEITFRDVLVGEVWFCAGQSNTELPLCNGWNPHFRDGKGVARAQITRKPYVRFCYQSDYRCAVEPGKTPGIPVEWKTFTPENLMKGKSFSAMGVYYALELYSALDVPIGIIGAYWGGTRIEPWTPASGLASVEPCKSMATQKLLTAQEYKALEAAGKKPPLRCHDQPRVLWNEMVAPWVPYSIRGFIWYQGCSNAGEGHRYADKMHALYNGWAHEFENPNLKLYFVQLAPWGYHGIAAIQEGQAIFAAAEKNAGMAIINDCGNLSDIHPNDKETVGQRLALLALKRDYGFSDIKADSPTLKGWKMDGDSFVLSFNDAEGWYLYNPDWSLKCGFEIAGADGKFVPAKISNLKLDRNRPNASSGMIEGRDLVIRADGISEPKKLRYLFSHPWYGSLYNEAGLPLGAFHIGD